VRRNFFKLVVRGLTPLSLLLCVAVVVAWVAAQWRGGYVEYMGVDPATMRDRQAMV